MKYKTTLKATLKKLTGIEKIAIGLFLVLASITFSQFYEIQITPRSSISKEIEGESSKSNFIDSKALTEKVLPSDGVELPIKWGDLGKSMVEDGVIDEQKFRTLFENNLTPAEEVILNGDSNNSIVLNLENSRFILDMLWAFGLANNNPILDEGEMSNPQYGGAQNFASTGGWTLAKGNGFDHYSKHKYVVLSAEEQALVEEVSKGIFRPCCGNSTHFPDCNHGMAMLGLLQLMAKNGSTKEEMYDIALKVNSYWFPQTYMDLAQYFNQQGIDWSQVDAKAVLGAEYSSGQGYQQIRKQLDSYPSINQGGGGSCGA